MYNRHFVVPAATLNTGNDFTISNRSLRMAQEEESNREPGRSKKVYWYPSEFQIINDTGDWVYVNFFSAQEYKEYLNDPSDFDFIRIPNGYILQDEGGMEAYQIVIVRGVNGGSAASDLTIELLRYVI